MRLFLTGATGFIGSNFLRFNKNKYSFIHCFKRGDNLKDRLSEIKPDLIINCAAEVYNESEMWSTNYEMVLPLVSYVKSNKHVKLVQLGSSSEYGSFDRPTKETDRLLPKGMYSVTKAMATTLCTTESINHDLKIVVVRPYSPYGIGEKPHRLFPMLIKAFKYNRPMDLTDGVHDFCYIKDFIDGLNLVIDNSNDRGEIVNISSGVETSNKEVYDTFVRLTGNQNAPVSFLNKFVTYPKWQCDNSFIKNKYRWKCNYNLERGIEDFLKSNFYE